MFSRFGSAAANFAAAHAGDGPGETGLIATDDELPPPAVTAAPDRIGPLVAAGPIVAWIVAAVEGAAVVGGISALGAGLYSIGIPRKSVLQYETSLKAGKFMLVVHGTPDEVARSREILSACGASETELHTPHAVLAGV